MIRPGLLLIACMAIAWTARAQSPQLPAGGGLPSAGQTHGWVVLPGLDDGQTLVHLPPRGSDPGAGTPGGETGIARIAARLTEAPDAITVVGERAYLIFAPKKPASDAPANDAHPVRAVLSIAAYPTGLPGFWRYDPPSRLRSHRALDHEGDLLGLAPTPRGPMALLAPSEPGARLELLVLIDGAWTPVALPLAAGMTDHRARLLAWGDGVAMLVVQGRSVELWIGSISTQWIDEPPENPADPDNEQDADEPPDEPISRHQLLVAWHRQPTAMPSTMLDAIDGPGQILEMLGELVVVERDASTLTLRTISEDQIMLLARVEGVGERFGVVPLRDSDRIALIWTDPTGRGSALQTVLVEVSAATGRELYHDQANFTGPISPGEFRALALAMAGLTMLVLVYLLRGGAGDDAILLPAGWSLIQPGRRLGAAAIDLLVAAALTGALLGISIFDALTLDPLAGDRLESWGLAVTLVVGMVVSILCEVAWGRTLGKWLVGARVTRQGERIRRPTPGGAVVRNACKWLLPPLSVLALWDPNGRHRGDVLARTLVVVPIEPMGDPTADDPASPHSAGEGRPDPDAD